MGIFDFVKRIPRLGRRKDEPKRDTIPFPNLIQIGRVNSMTGLVYKATPRNLRFFSRTPYARRAINAIKNPIKMLEWEIVPIDGVEWNSELRRQETIVKTCFCKPNETDDFELMLERVLEDCLVGAGALETQVGGDPNRPLWMWPVDGLSIQLYAEWKGDPSTPRYAQTVGYGSEFGGGEVKHLRDDELLYIAPNPNTSTPFGFGPLEIAFDTVASLLSIGKFANSVAGNMRPSIGLDFPGLPPAELEVMRAFWRNDVEGTGQVPMFASHVSAGDAAKAAGMQVLRFYPEGDNGLFLKYQEMLQRALAVAFDLSPQNLGIERDVNRDTSEVAEDRDWDVAIKPWAHDISRALTRHCIQRKLGFSQLQFRFVGFDREDEMATSRIFDLRYKQNSLTPNEIRDRFGEAPLDNEFADKLFIDTQVALFAARNMGQDLDQDVPAPKSASKKSTQKG